ncbi:sensor histidine kinase [Tritonibacter mobilis]|uniref:sensor histidine kinase n=1 Tax=Tritonibacter mobilis TaxID=379347 RepID=UPI00144722A5|nr:sensor histidine kinase [Rhodobacteraceae bacterium R_SAG6]
MMKQPNPVPEQIRVAEIRHRMNNGLQILQAFTRRQISACKTSEATSKLSDILRQIEAVAAQESALIEADSGNLAGFVERIEPLWQRIGAQAGITVHVDLDAGLTLSPKASETASRILLEAVTNCVEHAFPDGRDGTIEVILKATGTSHCHCRVTDDGVGMKGKNLGSGTGIIRTLAEEIGGRAEWTSGPRGGTALTVDFPVNFPQHVEAMKKADA